MVRKKKESDITKRDLQNYFLGAAVGFAAALVFLTFGTPNVNYIKIKKGPEGNYMYAENPGGGYTGLIESQPGSREYKLISEVYAGEKNKEKRDSLLKIIDEEYERKQGEKGMSLKKFKRIRKMEKYFQNQT